MKLEGRGPTQLSEPGPTPEGSAFQRTREKEKEHPHLEVPGCLLWVRSTVYLWHIGIRRALDCIVTNTYNRRVHLLSGGGYSCRRLETGVKCNAFTRAAVMI